MDGARLTMKISLRISLLAGFAAALTLPVAAQDVVPQPVLEDDAVPVSAPAVNPALTLPPVPRYPSVMQWPVAHARKLLMVIESVGAEGLDPADYKLVELRAAIEAGPGRELDAAASQAFTWLVEDLRDGRTPMEARRQWFVVDPDPDLLPTGRLMTDALATGQVASVLGALNPTHPDYAALRDELANTPVAETKRRTLIRANMDRWRWLQRDL